MNRDANRWTDGTVSDITFKLELPCPDCGNRRLIGYAFLDQEGRHQHTHYICTWWPSYGAAATQRCGWHGWTVRRAEDSP